MVLDGVSTGAKIVLHVGSSRGGAVALNIDSKDTPMVLLCPAWKKWGNATTVKPNTVILHSRADDVIPFSERTKAALEAYKARGGKLGASRPECRNLTMEASRRGAVAAGESARRDADTAYTDLYPIMREHRDEGVSLRAIARHLNDEGYETRRGRPWNHVQVRSVLKRYEE